MSGEPNIPNITEGVMIPGWFHRYLEATAPTEGQENIPPPAALVIPPPSPRREDNFAKNCKDFRAMGEKPFHGNETFVKAQN